MELQDATCEGKETAMERKEFEKCCQAIEEGVEIFLENSENHRSGKVLYCTRDQFLVRVEDGRETWPAGSCEEISSSSESPHSNL